MAPLLIPIVTMLANKEMSLLSSALEAGEDKAVDFIEQKTGIKLSEPGVELRMPIMHDNIIANGLGKLDIRDGKIKSVGGVRG